MCSDIYIFSLDKLKGVNFSLMSVAKLLEIRRIDHIERQIIACVPKGCVVYETLWS